MAFPLPAAQAGPSAVPILDVEALLDRLPAEVRARVIWAKRPIEQALHRLRGEPLTDTLLTETATVVVSPLVSLSGAVWQAIANRDELRAALLEDFEREETQLREYLGDEDALDTLTWLVAFWRSLLSMVLSLTTPAALAAALDEETIAEFANDPRLTPMYKSRVALMAALECSKKGDPPGRAIELLDLAFLEMMKVRESMRQDGLWLALFPNETTTERRKATLQYALKLRDSLSDDDWKVLDQARMRDLR